MMGDHGLLKAIDYLGSRGAGLLIATQKLTSEEKKETEQQRGGMSLVTAHTRWGKKLRGGKITGDIITSRARPSTSPVKREVKT